MGRVDRHPKPSHDDGLCRTFGVDRWDCMDDGSRWDLWRGRGCDTPVLASVRPEWLNLVAGTEFFLGSCRRGMLRGGSNSGGRPPVIVNLNPCAKYFFQSDFGLLPPVRAGVESFLTKKLTRPRKAAIFLVSTEGAGCVLLLIGGPPPCVARGRLRQ